VARFYSLRCTEAEEVGAILRKCVYCTAVELW